MGDWNGGRVTHVRIIPYLKLGAIQQRQFLILDVNRSGNQEREDGKGTEN